MSAPFKLLKKRSDAIANICSWMCRQLELDNCLYQEDVVDYILKNKKAELLVENSAGNLVVGKLILTAFQEITGNDVVWVRPDRYWRYRVNEDESGRNARG